MRKNNNRFLTILLLILAFTAGNLLAITDDGISPSTKNMPSSYFKRAYKIAGASIARVTGTNKVLSISFIDPQNNSRKNVSAGTLKGTLDNTATNFYCIDLHHNLAKYSTGQPHEYTDNSVTPAAITYILNNYYPFKNQWPSGSGESTEAAAVQVSIWHYSDGVDINTVDNAAVKARAFAIVADADANAGNTTPVPTLLITPASQANLQGQNASFAVAAYDNTGVPLQNINFELVSTSGSLSGTNGVTGTNGQSPSYSLSQGSSSSSVVTATATTIIPQGTRYVHSVSPDSYQKLVLATPTVAKRSVTVSCTWTASSDLKLLKTVDNNSPKNGDIVTFTITATNDGPSKATGVKVTDLLPQGTEFIQATTSNGAYDQATGIWNIGSVEAGSSVVLTIKAKINVSIVYHSAFDLGPAKGFNLFVLEDLDQPSSDTQGKIAVGRDAFLRNYSAGDMLADSHGSEDVLVVGRNLTYLTGKVTGGNVVYGGASNLPADCMSIINGTVRKDSPIDFAQAANYLNTLSGQLAAKAVNGTTEKSYSAINLKGTNPFVNVFKVSGNMLTNSSELNIDVPNGSTVLINIDSSYVKFHGGLVVNNTNISNVLYNFYEAVSITISGIDVRGSVLAPKADLDYPSGQLNGQLICKSMKGAGQVNLPLFNGNIPCDVNLVNSAEVTSSDQLDPDSTPGNGVVTEDDYSKVLLSIDFTPSNPNSGAAGNTNWAQVPSFPAGELIWKIVMDKDNYLVAGTWGGKIYRSVDNGKNWILLNSGMQAAYIWSIVCDASGNIYVGTERGVFVSKDNGAAWSSSPVLDKDTRSIVADKNGDLFAGTWGSGIFKSADKGATWTSVNAGLPWLVIHALAVGPNNELFAGGYGSIGGVYKSVDGGANWTVPSTDNSSIWALAVDKTGKIYAGTYGNGVLRSNDNGSTWTKVNGTIPSQFIYGVAVDQLNNVYVTTWMAGVYGSSDAGNSWTSLGMEGFGVSTVATNAGSQLTAKANQNANIVYVGTDNGVMFSIAGSLTAVEDKNEMPEKYDLSQNYPNPFNPSTVIAYSIINAGTYTLKVYNMLGEEVATLVNGSIGAGSHKITFDASRITSGVYIYRLTGAGVNLSKKMMLIK